MNEVEGGWGNESAKRLLFAAALLWPMSRPAKYIESDRHCVFSQCIRSPDNYCLACVQAIVFTCDTCANGGTYRKYI